MESFYIKEYPGLFSSELCDNYVELFEETIAKDIDAVESSSSREKSTRINTMKYDVFSSLNALAITNFQQAIQQYKQDINLHPAQWPREHGWEEFRVKRYLCGENEQFHEHVDVTNREDARRFLILMVYLNDNFRGGETEFTILGNKITPEKGKLLVFPPYWNYLHRGNPAEKPGYAKYFLSTYLHFIR